MWVKLIFIGIITVIVAFRKIVNIIQPTGTYSMYTIHNYFDGTITNCAKHDLVKGMDDFYIVYKICDVVWKIYLREEKSRRQIWIIYERFYGIAM
jgi:hypothetical protein